MAWKAGRAGRAGRTGRDGRDGRRDVLTLLLLLVSTLADGKPSFVLDEGDPCMYSGTCRLLSDCPEAMCARERGLYVDRCFMRGRRQYVCCDQERVSVRMCALYRQGLDHTFTILNGTAAVEREFPHMVAIRPQDGDFPVMCGGTLISESFVLTAAHCFAAYPAEDTARVQTLTVLLGATHLQEPSEASLEVRVERVILPRTYDYDADAYDDIALVQLSQTVDFSEHIMPACLYVGDVTDNMSVTATGWGATKPSGLGYSDQLYKVDLSFTDLDTCNRLWSNMSSHVTRGITPAMLCAGGAFRDTCRGDSGGPITYRDVPASALHSVVGVTSLGPRPCSSSIPSIYTRVSSYADWIECVVWPPGH